MIQEVLLGCIVVLGITIECTLLYMINLVDDDYDEPELTEEIRCKMYS